MSIEIYHNPRCSKSRQTLALLKERGIEPKIRLYLTNRPSRTEIRTLVKMLGLRSAREMMRTGEQVYKDLGLKNIDDEERLIMAMAEHPKLIERPVVITGGKAAIGRPPESVLEIL